MARGEIHAARVRLRDGNRVPIRERRERRDGAQVAAEVRREDHRPLRGRNPARDGFDVTRARLRRGEVVCGSSRPRGCSAPASTSRGSVRYTGPRGSDIAISSARPSTLVGRLAGAQLVVPLRVLAHDAGLIEILLAPVDRRVARGDVAALRDRRAARDQQQRHVVAVRVHQRADRVAGAYRDVNHHGRGFAGHLVVAVRHRDSEVLVRDREEARNCFAAARERHEALDDRREVGARVREHVIDAAPLERAQEAFGDRARCSFCPIHKEPTARSATGPGTVPDSVR